MPKESGPGLPPKLNNPLESELESGQGTGTARKKIAESAAGETQQNLERDRMVLEHLPLVKVIALRVKENLPVHVDLDDLISAGIVGLLDAIKKYNKKYNPENDQPVVFASYAKHRIKGAILDSLRQLDWASRDMRKRQKQIEAATHNLEEKLLRKPTEEEMAKALGLSIDDFRLRMVDLRTVGLMSASTRKNEDDDLPTPDFPASPDTRPDNVTQHEQLRSILTEAVMQTLDPRYQTLLRLYYKEEKTMKEIGDVLSINESRVSQMHKLALEKLQEVLRAKGINSSQDFGFDVLRNSKNTGWMAPNIKTKE